MMPHDIDTLKLPQAVPQTISKTGPLTFPGATPATTAAVARLLERDRAVHHCFFGPGFHNHLSHHLLVAYDLGASEALLEAIYDNDTDHLLPVFTADRPNRVVERQPDVLTRENWTKYLGQEKYYANLVQFFADEVARLGANAAFEEYVFSEDANRDGVHMVERFVGGAVHPLIQMGYAVEFGSPAMVAQALAQTAVHSAFFPALFPWNAPNDPSPPSSAAPSALLAVFADAYRSGELDPVMPYDSNALLSKRYKDALTPERCATIRALIARWVPSASSPSPAPDASDLAPTELARKAEDLAFVATLAFAGTGKRGFKPRLDFFLMHILTSALFIPHLLDALAGARAKARLLAAYAGVFFAITLSRGSPKFDSGLLMAYSADPRGPLKDAEGTTPAALGDKSAQANAWTRMLAHILPARDAHTLKAFRSLAVFAQHYGTVSAGTVRGADGLSDGEKLDGSAFVRAAGLLLDVMGWVGPGGGQEEGKWDRSALGWDEAWEEERKEMKTQGKAANGA